MMPRKIKLFWQLGAVLALLMVVGIAAAVVLPRMGVSDLYRHYQDNPHLAVTYLRNFPVNDTLAVDVTILTALDDEGWDTLCSDFGVSELPEIIQKKIEKGKDMASIRHVSKGNPFLLLEESESTLNDIASISRLNRTISIFYTETEAEQLAVNRYQFGIGFED